MRKNAKKKRSYWTLDKMAFIVMIILMALALANYLMTDVSSISSEDLKKQTLVNELAQQVHLNDPKLAATYSNIESRKKYYLESFKSMENALSKLRLATGIAINDTLQTKKGFLTSEAAAFEDSWAKFKEKNNGRLIRSLSNDTSGSYAVDPQYKDLLAKANVLQATLRKSFEAKQSSQSNFRLLILLLFILFAIGIYVFYKKTFLKPLNILGVASEKFTHGNFDDKIPFQAKNEIGFIGKNLNLLAQILKNANEFTSAIGDGNYNAEYEQIAGLEETENGMANSLLQMQEKMKKAALADEERRWVAEGLAKFADILRRDTDNQESFSYNIVKNLVKYLAANQGAVFIVNNDPEDGEVLELKAAYAYNRKKQISKKIKPGEGLVGQAFQEKDKISLTEIPQDYITIKSGLGEANPTSILIVPMMVNDEIQGMIELASFKKFGAFQIEFIEKLGESIASAVLSVKNNETTSHLLEESQAMTEQLRAQEEEMRQNMEEMQATQEEMNRAQSELGNKGVSFNALIDNTEDSILLIDKQYEVIIMNDVLRRRYENTKYSYIKEGTNVIELLADDEEIMNEWKEKYDRAFSGEKLEFVIESSLAKENSYRRYRIYPITTENEIIGCSVFSRDVTDEKKMEVETALALNDLQQKNKLFDSIFLSVELNTNKEIIKINEQALNAFGLTKQEALGKHINEFFVDENSLRTGEKSMIQGDVWKEPVGLKLKYGVDRLDCTAIASQDQNGDIAKYLLLFDLKM